MSVCLFQKCPSLHLRGEPDLQASGAGSLMFSENAQVSITNKDLTKQETWADWSSCARLSFSVSKLEGFCGQFFLELKFLREENELGWIRLSFYPGIST